MHNKRETQLHFVGIGGIGKSGIAEVFLNQGYRITGSDLSESDLTKRLRELGVRIDIGHRAENIAGANVVVISSAVRPTNPEVLAAKQRRIPVIPRAEMLGELMRGKTGIAIAGTHGKTTTTSMLATMLTDAKLDPTLVIGGKVDSLGGNAKLGHGNLVVAEADESDGSFLHLPAMYAVVTNIDNDHMDHYGSMAALDDAFVNFIGKLPFYGFAAVCADDPGVQRVLARFTKPVITYGLSEGCDIFARNIQVAGLGSSFEVCAEGRVLGRLEVSVPGVHNVLNALAAAAIGLRLGLSFSEVAKGLAAFHGVKRRFEIRWENRSRGLMVVDDYGHHPTEVAATLKAARSVWKGRVLTVFQPHRFTRTLHCHDDFLKAFRDCDALFLTDIYAAGEDPIDGVNSEVLARDISVAAKSGQVVRYAGSLDSAREMLLQEIKDGDLVLCLGAGSITRLPEKLVEGLNG